MKKFLSLVAITVACVSCNFNTGNELEQMSDSVASSNSSMEKVKKEETKKPVRKKVVSEPRKTHVVEYHDEEYYRPDVMFFSIDGVEYAFVKHGYAGGPIRLTY
jgi:hypothetical protein